MSTVSKVGQSDIRRNTGWLGPNPAKSSVYALAKAAEMSSRPSNGSALTGCPATSTPPETRASFGNGRA